MSTPTKQEGLKTVIVGATGAVGKQLLLALLGNPHYSEVHSFGRRPTGVQHEKLHETTIDFHALLNEAPKTLRGLKNLQDAGQGSEGTLDQGWSGPEGQKLSAVAADTVFITLGTTRAQAGSMPAFEVIDRGYAVAAAAAALNKAKSVSERGQKLLYCSSGAGNSSSWFPYLRSKGETDEAMTALPYTNVTIVQPGMLLDTSRDPPRYLEAAAQGIFKQLGRVTDSLGASVHAVGVAMAGLGTRSIGEWQELYGVPRSTPTGPGYKSAQQIATDTFKSFGGQGDLVRASIGNANLLKVFKAVEAKSKQ